LISGQRSFYLKRGKRLHQVRKRTVREIEIKQKQKNNVHRDISDFHTAAGSCDLAAPTTAGDLFGQWLLLGYGISVQSWGSWFGDWGKSLLLTFLFGSLLVWLLYAIIRRSAQRWWLYFWITSLPLLLLMMFASPYVIDPLFNKYEPLASKAPQLIPKLQEVSRRAGQEIPVERSFWLKASDKTIATNASVNGFGASKRVIIWDTTLAQEADDEVLTDFGLESGHYVLAPGEGLFLSRRRVVCAVLSGETEHRLVAGEEWCALGYSWRGRLLDVFACSTVERKHFWYSRYGSGEQLQPVHGESG
jgi:hypothetical protein